MWPAGGNACADLDLLLTVLVDPQRHGCLGQRLVQEQHSHHKVLGQGGQLSVENHPENTGEVSKRSEHGRRATWLPYLQTARHVAGWL